MIVVRRTSLACGRTSDVRTRSRTVLHDVLQHARQGRCTAFLDDALLLKLRLFKNLAVAVKNLNDGDRLNVYALVCKRPVSTRQFQRRHALRESAERRREILIVAFTVKYKSRYAHFLCIVNRLFYADLLCNLDRRHVERIARHRAQCHLAAVIAAVILRRPAADLDWAVVNDGIG